MNNSSGREEGQQAIKKGFGVIIIWSEIDARSDYDACRCFGFGWYGAADRKIDGKMFGKRRAAIADMQSQFV